MLQVRLLGQFDVRRDSTLIAVPSRAAQSLFAYLRLTAGTVHRREKLAGLLWPDTTDKNSRSNLRHELWRLRQAVKINPPRKNNPPYLIVDDIAIGFDPASDYWLDVSMVVKPLSPKETAELLQGNTARAQTLYEQAIPKLEETKDYPFLAIPLRRLGQLAMSQSDLVRASTFIQGSLANNWSVRDYRGVAACLAALGAVSMAHEQKARAARLFGAVDAVLEFIRTPILPFDQKEHERNVASVRTELDEATFAAAWADGHAMSLDQAIAYAMEDKPGD